MEKYFVQHCPNTKQFSSLERDKKTKVWLRTSAIVPCIALKSLAQRTSRISSHHQPLCIFPTFPLLLQWMIWRTFLQKLDARWRPLNSFRKIVRWRSFSWGLWKKQSRPLLSFTIMILERITTLEFPSQSPPSELSVNFRLDHNFSKVFGHRLKQLKTNSASFTKVTLWEFDIRVHLKQEMLFFFSDFPTSVWSKVCFSFVLQFLWK